MADDVQDNSQMKRIPIQKCRVSDLLTSAPADGSNGNFFDSPVFGRLGRVHVFGTVLDTYVSQDKNYAFFVLDDTTGVIRCKVFGNTTLVAEIKAGQMLDVIGRIREYNGERYITPEIARPAQDPNLETLRWLEILKILKEKGVKFEAPAAPVQAVPPEKSEAASVAEPQDNSPQSASEKAEPEPEGKLPKDARAKILEVISTTNGGEGAEHATIVSISGIAPDVVDSVVNELLSEGTCYEPRPGKIRLL